MTRCDAPCAPAPELDRRGQDVQDPRQVLREARVLQVEPAALAAVLGARDVRGRRDDRPVARIDDPRLAFAVGDLARVQDQRQQVAVAAEAAADLLRQAREHRAVAQQQVGGAERAGGQDQVVAGQRLRRRRLGRAGREVRVVDGVAAALARLEAPHVGQRADLRALVLGVREVVVIERVLGAEVAPDVAFAGHLARGAGPAVQVRDVLDDRLARHRRAALVGERDRELGMEMAQAELVRRFLERDRLRRRRVRLVLDRELLEPDHLLHAVVVRVERGAVHRPVLVPAVAQVLLHEPALVLADEDVRVDQRTAAEP